MDFGFIGPTYTSQSLAVDGERCVNLYPEIVAGRGKNNIVLYGTPGLQVFCSLPVGPVRALYTTSDRTFAVSGVNLYELYQNGSYKLRGTVKGGPNISLSSNGTQLIIASNYEGFIFNLATNTLSTIDPTVATANGWLGASVVTYIDGYFIGLKPDSQTFFISQPGDGTQWNALDFENAVDAPDNIVSMVANQRELWLFGQYRTEVYYDSGNPDFPFTRIEGSYIEQGCVAPYSVAKLNNTIYWLGGDTLGAGVVWAANGYIPTRISNHAVENAIQGYATISDAIAYAYQDRGHTFYVLHFPTADATWTYDVSTQMWHERGWWNNGAYHAHLARFHSYNFGQHLVGDYTNGNVYVMSANVYSDNGAPIRRMRTAPHISTEMTRNFYHQFFLDMQVGVGDTVTLDPQVSLSWSNDGGYTFGSEQLQSAGKVGQTKTRVVWRRLGRARDRVFKVVISDPVYVALINAYLDMTPGTS